MEEYTNTVIAGMDLITVINDIIPKESKFNGRITVEATKEITWTEPTFK